MSWEEIRERAQAAGISPHLVLKEQIHLLILDHLFRKGAFSGLVFQGGTALRLAYQGVRLSEDLDFVLSRKDDPIFQKLPKVLEALPSALSRYPLFGKEGQLKEQKATAAFKRFTLDIPVEGFGVRDRTHLEIANVPSYANQPVVIRTGMLAVQPAIRVETPGEILSDKLTAFGSREFVKGRDVWDIHFLMSTLHLGVDPQVRRWVRKKRSDYRLKPASFRARFRENLEVLGKTGPAILRTEMERFLPAAYRNLFLDQYRGIVKAVWKALADFIAAEGKAGQA